MADPRPKPWLRTLIEWLALIGLAVLLGLLAARVRLFDSGWAVATLAVVVAALVGIGLHAYLHLWDEDEDDDEPDREDSARRE